MEIRKQELRHHSILQTNSRKKLADFADSIN